MHDSVVHAGQSPFYLSDLVYLLQCCNVLASVPTLLLNQTSALYTTWRARILVLDVTVGTICLPTCVLLLTLTLLINSLN